MLHASRSPRENNFDGTLGELRNQLLLESERRNFLCPRTWDLVWKFVLAPEGVKIKMLGSLG